MNWLFGVERTPLELLSKLSCFRKLKQIDPNSRSRRGRILVEFYTLTFFFIHNCFAISMYVLGSLPKSKDTHRRRQFSKSRQENAFSSLAIFAGQRLFTYLHQSCSFLTSSLEHHPFYVTLADSANYWAVASSKKPTLAPIVAANTPRRRHDEVAIQTVSEL